MMKRYFYLIFTIYNCVLSGQNSKPIELNGIHPLYNKDKKLTKIGFFEKNHLIGGVVFTYDTNNIIYKIHVYDNAQWQSTIFNRDTLEKEKNLLKKKEEASQVLIAEQKLKTEYEKKQKLNLLYFLCAIGLILLWVVYLYLQNNRKKLEIEIQNKIISDKQKELLDSIHYAKRIQTSLLPREKYIERVLNQQDNKSSD